jgi:hypothetical protein
MFVGWKEMPENARLWNYTSSRLLGEAEVAALAVACQQFCNEWAAHGSPLKASFQMEYGCVLRLAVDESLHVASGCSIDSSVKLVKEWEQKLNISFFDRMLSVPMLGSETRPYGLEELKQAYEAGKIDEDTFISNTTAAQKIQLDHAPVLPLSVWWAYSRVK